MPERAAMLQELAVIVREFTEPREHREMVEHREIHLTSSGRTRSRLIRRSHVTYLPPLLAALRQAAIPAELNTGHMSGSFVSQPAANLTAVSTYRRITDELATWCRRLGVAAATEERQLTRLVSARHTDNQLGCLVDDARIWHRDSVNACGEEDPPRTLDQPCPICQRRNVLVMRGDGSYVRCTRCLTDWDQHQVGILSQMLEANRQHGTLPDIAARCPSLECVRRGAHTQHQDHRGRTWPDGTPAPYLPAATLQPAGLP